MSSRQKYRHRKRLQLVDSNVAILLESIKQTGEKCEAVTRLEDPKTFPTEKEMLPKDKYTVYSKHSKGYRKGIHKMPKWTRISQRVNPDNF